MRNVATVSSGWNFQTKSLLRMFVPPLSRWLCATVPSLSIAFFSLSLSLSFPYSLRFFSKKTGPLLLSLSLQVFKHTHKKREPYTTTTAISLSASQNILYIWCVFGLSICVSDVLFAFASHPIEKEREMNSYSCVQSTATF